MDSNITDQQYLATDLQLSEPRFDEEATVLSARPVVPLNDVKTEARSGKRLAFGLAIVFAVLAGVFGGSLIYKQREQKQSAAIADTGTTQREPVISRDETLSGAVGVVSDDPHSSPLAEQVAENGDNLTQRDGHKGGANRKTGKSAPVLSDNSRGVNETLKDRHDSQSDERELRRAERKEARRLIRDAEREGIKEARGHRASEDLLKIREIFEGVRKP